MKPVDPTQGHYVLWNKEKRMLEDQMIYDERSANMEETDEVVALRLAELPDDLTEEDLA